MTHFSVNTEHPVIIPSGEIHLDGILHIPKEAIGVVLFAHGSGSSRFSVRNQFVARKFQDVKLATLLFDLFTPEEEELDERTLELRFDIEFLASRLISATHWIITQPIAHELPLGYFGASTGGGAALVAAAAELNSVKAVVSRGGRPDLAEESLIQVKAPTLLIVGGDDQVVIELNQQALQKLICVKKLEIVPGATHLFEEPGTLEQVAELAKKWFINYLPRK
jgi:putative phosphoribosyl transferase